MNTTTATAAAAATASSGFIYNRLLLQVNTSRWFMMFVSFLIMTCPKYLFCVYSKDVKATFFLLSIHTQQPFEHVQGPRRQSESSRASSPRWFVTSHRLFHFHHCFQSFQLCSTTKLQAPLGSFVLNVRIVGKLYDKEALNQSAAKGVTRSMAKELAAFSKNCYRISL
ncbi:hypothetical protein V6N11_070486 [Hibiscus sabdariffa]|uniref:Uncharacterized protein n=1 Tax=Hibiscus sabdariffa TaxID=183260 RepID=A0ABR2QF51_9ROSI